MRILSAENRILIEKSDEVNSDTILELERVEQEMAERETPERPQREEARQALAAAEVTLLTYFVLNRSFQHRVTSFFVCSGRR